VKDDYQNGEAYGGKTTLKTMINIVTNVVLLFVVVLSLLTTEACDQRGLSSESTRMENSDRTKSVSNRCAMLCLRGCGRGWSSAMWEMVW
jgi:hypothetical protein